MVFGGIEPSGQRLAIDRARLFESIQRKQCARKVRVGRRRVGIQPNRLALGCDRILELGAGDIEVTQRVTWPPVVGIDRGPLLVDLDGALVITVYAQVIGRLDREAFLLGSATPQLERARRRASA